MSNFQKLQETKSKIINFIQNQGPNLPTKVAKETGFSPLFISAFLAELVSEKKLKITNMKVGSSPVYYLHGQENKLENFTEHLNSKEKEAFHLLKDSLVLEDQEQLPAIRVALRSIKDFAVPIQARISGELKLFWKFYLLNQEETKKEIQNIISPSQKTESPQHTIPKNQVSITQPPAPKQPMQSQTPKSPPSSTITKTNQEPQQKEILDIFSKEIKEKSTPAVPKTLESQQPQQKLTVLQESDFSKLIKTHLEKNSIKILEEISSKKKEYMAKVQHFHQLFGNQSFFLIAKDKKKITENDLVLALQKSQTEKMPALIISPGDLDKKAQAYLNEYKNLIKFQQI